MRQNSASARCISVKNPVAAARFDEGTVLLNRYIAGLEKELADDEYVDSLVQSHTSHIENQPQDQQCVEHVEEPQSVESCHASSLPPEQIVNQQSEEENNQSEAPTNPHIQEDGALTIDDL